MLIAVLKDHILLILLTNCLSDVVASLASVRQGFLKPPGVVLRSCIEDLSCIIASHTDDSVFKQIQSKKYDRPKSISIAKNYFSGIGHLYGTMTKNFTHESLDTAGRALQIEGENLILMLVPGVQESKMLILNKVLILVVAQLAQIIGEIAEWIFADFLTEYSYWVRKIGSPQLTGINTPGKSKIQSLMSIMSNDLIKN